MAEPTKYQTALVRLTVDMNNPRVVTVRDQSGAPRFTIDQDADIPIAEIVKYDVQLFLDSPFVTRCTCDRAHSR